MPSVKYKLSLNQIHNIIKLKVSHAHTYAQISRITGIDRVILEAVVADNIVLYNRFLKEAGVHLGSKKEPYYKKETYGLPKYTFKELSSDEKQIWKELEPNEARLKLYSFEKETDQQIKYLNSLP